ncbi:peptidase [Noviherbaspirillum cavernae]|uniref:Peptidase n=2 Tax=Noviherbaspirillum cavernae TaxID=2320862 RepID=A0A418X6F5_9BURK|nr:peptidase [Noviherbaspirillum cavernae]
MPPPCALPFFAQRIQAGFPSPAEEYLEAALDLNEYLVRNRTATFFFRVRGHSMRNAGILDNDILAADRSIKPKHHHIVVASIDGDFTVKRLYRRAGVIELRPENPDYEPIRLCEGQELVVWGVAIGTVRRFEV